MWNLQELKEIQVDRILDFEKAVAMSADLRTLENEYATLGLAVPAWVEKSGTILREEIARRTRNSDLAALKSLEAEMEGYKTRAEKLDEAQRRYAALQKKLGMTAKSGK